MKIKKSDLKELIREAIEEVEDVEGEEEPEEEPAEEEPAAEEPAEEEPAEEEPAAEEPTEEEPPVEEPAEAPAEEELPTEEPAEEEPAPENQKDLRDWFYDRAMSVPLAQVPSLFRMVNLFYKVSMRGMLKDNEEQFKKRIFGKESEAPPEEPGVE